MLVIDVIVLWFSDEMLFTLITLKIWRMAFGAARSKTWV